MVYEVVNMTVPALLNPKMTASWEKGLDGITRGTVIMEDYREKLEDFIRKETLNMVERNLTSQLVAQIQPLTAKGARGIAAKKKHWHCLSGLWRGACNDTVWLWVQQL